MVSRKSSPVFERYIRKYVKGKKILDIGCDGGNYLKEFPSSSIGIDVSKNDIAFCKERGLDARIGDASDQLQFGNEEFDVVFCSHTLEHVFSPFNLLRESYRVSKKGGILIIAVPTESSIVRVFKDDYFKDHKSHLYAFSLNNMNTLLEKTGFKIARVFINLRKVRQFHLWWLLDFVQRLPPTWVLWLSDGYWVIARKSRVS